MAPLRSDLRIAVRNLLRRPGFAAVAIGTIGLAVAANTTMFSLVDGVLLRPLPFADPERLVTFDNRASTGFLVSLSIPNYRDWRGRNRSFDRFGAWAGWGFVLTGRGPAEQVSATAVLGDLFATLGIRAAMGRVPGAEETAPGGEATVVLSHGFWRQRLGGDSSAIGQTLVLDGRPHVITGVLPEGVAYPDPEVQLYVPMGSIPGLPFDDRDSGFGTQAIARLAPGVSLALARSDMARVGRELREQYATSATQPEVRSLNGFYVGDARRPLLILMGAVGFVLLVAVANVGNLMLARGEDRRHELAVRTALGARGASVARLLLTEALVIVTAGGAIGTGLALVALRAVVPRLPAEIPPILAAQIGVDGGVLLFSLLVSLVAGLAFGLTPALRAARTDPHHAMRAGARASGPGQARLRSALVVAEVGLSLVLLVGAALMLKSLNALQRVEKGFNATGVLTGAVAPSDGRTSDRQSWLAYYDEVLARTRALPGVRQGALLLLVPLSNRSWELGLHPEGVPVERETRASVLYNVVTPEYFDVFEVPLLRGRNFNATDREGTPLVAIVDETMAERYWPGLDPIGKRITFETELGAEGGPPVYREIVGVVPNLRHYELQTPSRIQVYVPFHQTFRRGGMTMRIALRTDVPPDRLVEPVRRAVAAMDPDAPFYAVQTMEDFMGRALGRSVSLSRVLAGFGVAALGLAGLGVFGVMSYAVARRRREIGIRIALGARGDDVVRWMGARMFRLVALGTVLGLVAAALLSGLLGRLLFEVKPLDPAVYTAMTLTLLAVALVATWVPARRGTRVDPVIVLKEEG